MFGSVFKMFGCLVQFNKF